MAVILVIDDDELVRKTIHFALTSAGHQVIEAGNGAEGVELFKRSKVDLTICDIIMPEKEGLDTIMTLRRLDPNAKIIAVSGGGRVGNLDFLPHATKLGAMEALAKPFAPRQLVQLVARCLGTEAATPARHPAPKDGE
jgi:two-component system, chemotaxis family, chemotaxis protein CheY